MSCFDEICKESLETEIYARIDDMTDAEVLAALSNAGVYLSDEDAARPKDVAKRIWRWIKGLLS
jgi:hypothetical protein